MNTSRLSDSSSLHLREARQFFVGHEHGPVEDPLGLPEVVAVPSGAGMADVLAPAPAAAAIADKLE